MSTDGKQRQGDGLMAYIETQAPEKMVKQRKNKLKGMAMEYAIKKLMQDVEAGEQSLSDLLKEAEDYLEDVYTVKKMFRIWDNEGSTTFRRQVREFGEDYRLAFDKQDLQGQRIDIKVPEKSSYVKLGYRKCGNCQFIYPPVFCKNCGGALTENRFWILKKIKQHYSDEKEDNNASKYENVVKEDRTGNQFRNKIFEIKQAEWNAEEKWGRNEFCNCDNPNRQEHYFKNHKKCRKCKKGYFSFIKTEFSKKDWNAVKTDVNFDEAKQYLLEEGFISKSSFADKIKSKRVDTWKYDGDRVHIYESKNKEKTSLTYGNIAQAFYYIKALRKAGLTSTKDAWVIYNGKMPDSLKKSILHFESVYGYSIRPLSLKSWCREQDVYIDTVLIGKNVDGERVSESGDYKASLSKSKSPVGNPKIKIEVSS